MTVGHNGVNNIRDGKAEWVADDAAPARRTADTITDDELDALYDELYTLRAQLSSARTARRRISSALIAVAPLLEQPYPDDPRWTPWTRFVQPALRELREALLGPARQSTPATKETA